MRSISPPQTASTLLHLLLLTTSISSAPTSTYTQSLTLPRAPLTVNTTIPPPLTIWPTLPWWTKLRNTNLDPPAFLDIFSLGRAATPQQTSILLEIVLLPLAQLLHQGEGLANETVRISSGEGGGVGAEFVPVVGREPSREVAATAVAALAMAEWNFGGRGVGAGVRVGDVRVAGIEVWVGGEVGRGE